MSAQRRSRVALTVNLQNSNPRHVIYTPPVVTTTNVVSRKVIYTRTISDELNQNDASDTSKTRRPVLYKRTDSDVRNQNDAADTSKTRRPVLYKHTDSDVRNKNEARPLLDCHLDNYPIAKGKSPTRSIQVAPLSY